MRDWNALREAPMGQFQVRTFDGVGIGLWDRLNSHRAILMPFGQT
jgi:hypothetical protein